MSREGKGQPASTMGAGRAGKHKHKGMGKNVRGQAQMGVVSMNMRVRRGDESQTWGQPGPGHHILFSLW